MAGQVEVAAVVDALELLPAEREAVLDVDRLLGVVGQLVRRVLAEAQARRRRRRTARTRPAVAAATPRRPRRPSSGRTKYCISICSNSRIRKTKLPGLISLRKLLPIWAMPNGSFLRDRLLDVLEVDVRALGRLGAQVDDRGVLLDRAHERLEHEVEAARRRQRAAVVRAVQAQPLDDPRVAQVGRGQVLGAGQLVEAEAAVVGLALDQRVAERADVAGRDPDLRVHEDAGVEADDVVALLDHRPPPGALDVVLQLDAERPVVPDGVDAAVDLARAERRSRAAWRARRSSRGRRRRARRRPGRGRVGRMSRHAPWGDRPWQGRSRGLGPRC